MNLQSSFILFSLLFAGFLSNPTFLFADSQEKIEAVSPELKIQKLPPEAEENAKEENDPSSFTRADSIDREVLGWIERVSILHKSDNLPLDAKLSVSYSKNQLHAEDISLVKNTGKKKQKAKTIRFKVTTRNAETIELSAPYSSKRKNDGVLLYSVILPICIADKYMELEFELRDRKSNHQEVLIGRDALSGHFIIDPSKTKTHQPHCKLPE